nr:extracellular solute-binding protein [Sporichthyaceae bacterium]
WACDPLTMQGYVDQDLVGGWTPDNAADIPEQFRTDDSVGVAVLYMVAVHADDAPAPTSWSDLAGSDYDAVAVPDPNVAASALGALGWFNQEPGYGLDFYTNLQEQGAEQVSTPDDVTTGVAQGLYQAGITIANSAYLAMDSGSPIGVVWPEPGAVAIYGPIALAAESSESTLAKDFISYVASEPGQQVLAEAGSYPTLPGVEGPEIPADAPVVYPDWPAITADKDALLADYQQIFGG